MYYSTEDLKGATLDMWNQLHEMHVRISEVMDRIPPTPDKSAAGTREWKMLMTALEGVSLAADSIAQAAGIAGGLAPSAFPTDDEIEEGWMTYQKPEDHAADSPVI
jgi:hypothetical protein